MILLAIRLSRKGAKKHPFYRIIVTEKESKRDGRFLEIVGYYNPCREPNQLHLKQDRVSYWLKNGAQPTDTVSQLLKKYQPEAEKA